jgi:hypothetical protein
MQRNFYKFYLLLQLFSGRSPPRRGFDPRPVHVGLVGEMALEQVYLRVLTLSSDNLDLFILHERCIVWVNVSWVQQDTLFHTPPYSGALCEIESQN